MESSMEDLAFTFTRHCSMKSDFPWEVYAFNFTIMQTKKAWAEQEKKMSAKTHLTAKDRLQIECWLKAGKSLSDIAGMLGKSPSTIAREIKKHALESEKGAAGRIPNRCIHRYECKKANLCPQFPCAHPRHQLNCSVCSKCNSVCMDFIEEFCPRLKKSPYVCNGCKDEHKCVLHKRFYLNEHAQMEYEKVLTESRSGANITELELKAVDTFLSPLLENGQSPHNVMLTYPDKFSFCEKTLYRYIDANLLSARNYDLPRRTRLNPRSSKSIEHKVDKKCRIDRTLDDFKRFRELHPDTAVVQMDSVIGTIGGKSLLTFCFEQSYLLLAFIRDNNTSQSVIDIFDRLTDLFGLDSFRRLFPVILTDNGSEFSNPQRLEFDLDGNRRTYIFYCDPNRSDQKGLVEVEHEMIRRILPKGTSFDLLAQVDINRVISHINSYKREKLNDKSPFESFSFLYGKDILVKLGIYFVPAVDIILTPALAKR